MTAEPITGCDGCGRPLRHHEREAHPQVFCFRCATARGLERICDTPAAADELVAMSERAVEESLQPAIAMPPEERAQIAAVLHDIGGLNGGDITLLTFGGQRIEEGVVMDLMDRLLEANPDRIERPFLIVPHGWYARAYLVAVEEQLTAVADGLVEAPVAIEFEAVPYVAGGHDEEWSTELSADTRRLERWFLRDDLADDDVVEMLAEQGATGDVVHDVIAERALRRVQRAFDRKPATNAGKETP